MLKKSIMLSILVVLAVALAAGAGWGAVPNVLNIQAKITDKTTKAPITTAVSGTITFYNDPTAAQSGAPAVAFGPITPDSNGVISIPLDLTKVTPATPPLDFTKPYYVSVNITGQGESTTRQQLMAAPYAITAQNVYGGTGYFAGNVSLGSPTAKSSPTPITLSLGGTYSDTAAANTKLRIYDDGTSVGGLGVSAGQLEVNTWTGGKIAFNCGPAQSMVIDPAGHVGIGTASPVFNLHVMAPAAKTPGIITTTDLTNSYFMTSYSGHPGDPSAALVYPEGTALRFGTWKKNDGTGWTERIRIDTTGNVGIGTPAPLDLLDVSGAGDVAPYSAIRWGFYAPGMHSGDWNNFYARSYLHINGNGDSNQTYLAFQTHGWRKNLPGGVAGDGPPLVLTGLGYVGIGTTAPGQALDVLGNINFSGDLYQAGRKVTLGGGQWTGPDANNNIYNANTGFVGIGTAAPNSPLNFGLGLGEKISLWGDATAGAHYGFGIQSHNLQMYTDTSDSWMSFGYGGTAGTPFIETMRLTNATGDIPLKVFNPSTSGYSMTEYDVAGGYDVTGGSSMYVGQAGTANNWAVGRPNAGIIETSGDLFLGPLNSPELTITQAHTVGIGTTNPGAELDVVGNINCSGQFLSGGKPISQWPSATGGIYYPGGNVGIGSAVTAPLDPLEVAGNGSNGIRWSLNSTFHDDIHNFYARSYMYPGAGGTVNANDTYLAFKLHSYPQPGGTETTPLVLTAAGNVGIGTASPQYMLDVSDRMRLNTGPKGTAGLWLNNQGAGDPYDNAFIGMADGSHVGFWGYGDGTAATRNAGKFAAWGFLMDTVNGGLSVNSPSTGFIGLKITEANLWQVGFGTNQAKSYWYDFSNDLGTTHQLYFDGQNWIFPPITATNIYGVNRVGIGTTAPAANLEVRTSAFASGVTITDGGAGAPNLTVRNSDGSRSAQLGLATGSGGQYSTSAQAGDTVLRAIGGGNLIMQSGGGGPGVMINPNGSVYLGTGAGDITAPFHIWVRAVSLTEQAAINALKPGAVYDLGQFISPGNALYNINSITVCGDCNANDNIYTVENFAGNYGTGDSVRYCVNAGNSLYTKGHLYYVKVTSNPVAYLRIVVNYSD